jgi:hypothetical protein
MKTIYSYKSQLFDIAEKSKFLLEIIILVSSVNKMGSDKVLNVGGRSFIYIMKSKGPNCYV